MFLTNSDKNITIEEIEEIEKELDIIFPSELKNFYLKYNGGRPNKKFFIIDGFIENYEVISFKSMLENKRDLSILKHYTIGIEKGYLIKNLIPFASTFDGNFLCINKVGEVYYYTIDTWDFNLSLSNNLKENLYLLANSFNEFLDMLTEEPNPEFEDEE